MSGELELHIQGPDGQKVVPLGGGPLRLGRSGDNEIPLVEDKVLSRNHCVVEIVDGRLLVRDLGSRHGTWHRGQKVETHVVKRGDVLLIGRSRLIFLPKGSRPPAPPPPRGPGGPGQRRPSGRRQRPPGPPGGPGGPPRGGPPRSRAPGPSGPGAPPPGRQAPAPRPAPQRAPEPEPDLHDTAAEPAMEPEPPQAREPAYQSEPAYEPEPEPAMEPEPAPPAQEPEARRVEHRPEGHSAPGDDVFDEEPAPRVTGGKPRLPAGWPGGIAPADPNNFVQKILLDARKQGASDVHLMPDLPVTLRIRGQLDRQGRPLPAEVIDDYTRSILTDAQLQYFNTTGDYDFCYAFENGGRYRTNLAKSRTGIGATFRIVKTQVSRVTELGLPQTAEKLTTFATGLVLVTGPMGAGKTTSMMALVQLVNEDRPDHIITVEDPIEFVIEGASCHISQRELGIHTDSFDAALRAALREDPDIIVIGDMRDYETTSLAISASETGHLVFASMHAMSAAKTLDKLVDMFPAGEQSVIRQMVSESLRGILCQRLLPDTQGGRVPACELVFNSIAVANIIRDSKTAALVNAMQLGSKDGMLTLDNSIQKLLDQGLITGETAFAYAEKPDKFKHLVKGV